jgi:hypothetical protein
MVSEFLDQVVEVGSSRICSSSYSPRYHSDPHFRTYQKEPTNPTSLSCRFFLHRLRVVIPFFLALMASMLNEY